MNQQIQIIKDTQEIVIYGAGLMGKNLVRILQSSLFGGKILSFIVRDKIGNSDYIEGIPVISISDAVNYKDKLTLVALHEKHLNDALKDLQKEGFTKLLPISFDNDLWCDIREEWINANSIMPFGVEILKESCDTKSYNDMHVYVVHSVYDKELAEDVENKTYEISIQVGAKLTNKVLFPIHDDVGDNISVKNKKYCELTGLYWIWKNDKSDYIGLSHYRRKFELTDGAIRSIVGESVDIVVTVPILNLNTVKGQYIKDHSENDWNIMSEAISILSPEYSDSLETVGKGFFYFAYNMFIAKREVLNDYCEWLFKVLKYCEDKIAEKEDSYQNRYLGFLAERLLTVYIAKHTELIVRVAHKHFIESKVN